MLSLSTMEIAMGSLPFVACCLKIMFLTAALQLATYHTVLLSVPTLTIHNIRSMGFSSVLLGLLVVRAYQAKTVEFILFPGLLIDSGNAPLLAYLLATCLLTDASVLGHFSAMSAGLLLGSGVFLWLTEYWFGCLLLWCIGSVVVSLKKTTRLGVSMPFVKCERWPPWRIDSSTPSTFLENSVDDSLFVLREAFERVRHAEDSARVGTELEEPVGGQKRGERMVERVGGGEGEKKEHFIDIEAQRGGERKKGSSMVGVGSTVNNDSDGDSDDSSFLDYEFDEEERLL